MDKLISMTALTLKLEKKLQRCRDEGMPFTDLQTLKFKILNQLFLCAGFLSQKLELWMFVPCKLVDDVWIVLEEPKLKGNIQKFKNDSFNYNAYWEKQNKEYQEAKERVLFEGFELKGETDITWIFKHNGDFPIMIQKRNIEYLNTYCKIEITLTPTAKKQIGL